MKRRLHQLTALLGVLMFSTSVLAGCGNTEPGKQRGTGVRRRREGCGSA